jgi:hypothetical protein
MDERRHHRHGYELQRDDDEDRIRRRYGMGEQMRGHEDEHDELRARMGGMDMPRHGMMRGEGRGRPDWESGRGDWERGFESRGAGFGYGSHAGRGFEREFGGRGEMHGSSAQGGYGRSFACESGGMGIQSRMRGLGPKNYRRSDERIREDVCEMLTDADLDAREIDVKVRDGEVTLEGSVTDRWSKREAEDVVCQVRGVRDCHNQLRLEQRTQQAQSGRGNGRTSTNA